jgi:hypothetical protein
MPQLIFPYPYHIFDDEFISLGLKGKSRGALKLSSADSCRLPAAQGEPLIAR